MDTPTVADFMRAADAAPMPLDQLQRATLLTPREVFDWIRVQEAWWSDDLTYVAQVAFTMLRVRNELEEGTREGERQPRRTGFGRPDRPLAAHEREPLVTRCELSDVEIAEGQGVRFCELLHLALGFAIGVALLALPPLIDRLIRAAIGV